MKITITEYKQNFLGNDTGDGVNLDASIAKYCDAVSSHITSMSPEMEIEWDIRRGEGPSSVHLDWEGCEEDAIEENSILFSVDAIRERVFSQGEFWQMNK